MAKTVNVEPRTTRSFRVSEAAWEAARVRATAEGTTMSQVCGDLVEGYALGVYSLPQKQVVRTFPDPADE